jgi:metal-responsive CopG/Arc/MetJ family transcriptional regulator
MRDTIRISLSNNIKKEIDQIIKEDGISRSDIILKSLNDYLYFRKLNKLRNKMIFKARENNIFNVDCSG